VSNHSDSPDTLPQIAPSDKEAAVKTLLTLLCCALLATLVSAQEPSAVPLTPEGANVYSLDQFGPLDTPAHATATLQKAGEAIVAAGGGVLIIPKSAPATWKPENVSQHTWRKPAPPAPATQGWGNTPGVTVWDFRGLDSTFYVPQLGGFTLSRTMNLPAGEGTTHWGTYPVLRLVNNNVAGSSSFRDWLTEDVKAGKDQRFYVRTIRGIFPGQFLNTGDSGKVQRLYVKSIGYDREKQAPYFVADVDADVPARGSIIHNKTNTPTLDITVNRNNEDQSSDIQLVRHDYTQGDNYLFSGMLYNMGDAHSTAGDENVVIYNGHVRTESNIFRGKVVARDAAAQALTYTAGTNAQTLATGRPLINLNPAKWITGGTVLVVNPTRPSDYQRVDDPVFEGKTYPMQVLNEAKTGNVEIRMGGLIRFSKDAPITKAVVGRYFAVDMPNEMVPGAAGVRRWYLIHSMTENPDGTKEIKIVRHWWGAKPFDAPNLYNPDNFTYDGHVRPLKYIIAPGANVYDIARGARPGWENVSGVLDRTLRVAPGPDDGTPADFAPGDAIEQAIGPDPWNPGLLRGWIFEDVPGAFCTALIDLENWGSIARYSAMQVGGGPTALKEIDARYDKKPAWEHFIDFYAACGDGIIFYADVQNAAILFRQPNGRPQPIAWKYADGKQQATLAVSPADGTLQFQGNGIAANGAVSAVRGLSGTATPAKNLRGLNLSVPAGAKTLTVAFPTPEADAGYGVFVQLSWLTNNAVTTRTKTGFTVHFATPPGKGQTLSWLLVR
jgi:hypothetical protein